ncbi:MAG TPA: cation:proton antiporter, partial [Acetobacteraceae bacterium]
MAGPADPELFRPALIILGAAGGVIPIFHRLRISPLLGFILVGIAVGPFGLGRLAEYVPPLRWVTITDPGGIAPFGELGIVTLMFMIGLELSWPRLLVMRRLVFGFGACQVVACSVALGGIGLSLGWPPGAAILSGLALAMSSTAVVVQVLAAGKRMGAPVGRASLAVLLFQDLAAVPVLFAIGVLGQGAEAASAGWPAVLKVVGEAVLGIVVAVVAGRLALQPLLRSVARTRSPELFMAACLLVILGTGFGTALAGLSMAMGALIAGLLLAETEYRREIEVTIEPFKGLLLGVFLISVGMGLDLPRIVADPLPVLAGALLLLAVKFGLIALLGRGFGLSWITGVRTAMLLAPGGEFGFVILGAALAAGLIPPAEDGFVLILAAVTMAAIPALAALGDRIGRAHAVSVAAPEPVPSDLTPRVILAGYGRVGETVAALLDTHKIPYVAIDNDAVRVAELRKAGLPVFWGDVTRVEMLRNLNLDRARALVVTMSDHAAADRLVSTARAERDDLRI